MGYVADAATGVRRFFDGWGHGHRVDLDVLWEGSQECAVLSGGTQPQLLSEPEMVTWGVLGVGRRRRKMIKKKC